MYGSSTINQSAAQQRGNGAISGALGASIGMQEPVRAETEIEREMARLRNAASGLDEAVTQLWERLGRAGVLAPPTPCKESATAIEATISQLGGELQASACGVQSQARRLYDLMNSLCI